MANKGNAEHIIRHLDPPRAGSVILRERGAPMKADSKAGPLVRDAREDDLPAICEIYAHHVLHGQATFEEVRPD